MYVITINTIVALTILENRKPPGKKLDIYYLK